MTRILLTRHGQSVWNATGHWQGQADPPLSDLGRTQALRASERMVDHVGDIDAIVASDLQRASATASIISEALELGPVAIQSHLRERDAGEWSGLTKAEIEDRYPGFLESGRRPPNFEPDRDFLERVHLGLAAIHEQFNGADVLCVAHGGVVYALEREHGLPFERVANLAGRWVTHHGDRLVLGERVALIDQELLTTVPAQI